MSPTLAEHDALRRYRQRASVVVDVLVFGGLLTAAVGVGVAFSWPIALVVFGVGQMAIGLWYTR